MRCPTKVDRDKGDSLWETGGECVEETGEKISAAAESSATLVVKLDFDDPACPARAPSARYSRRGVRQDSMTRLSVLCQIGCATFATSRGH